MNSYAICGAWCRMKTPGPWFKDYEKLQEKNGKALCQAQDLPAHEPSEAAAVPWLGSEVTRTPPCLAVGLQVKKGGQTMCSKVSHPGTAGPQKTLRKLLLEANEFSFSSYLWTLIHEHCK